MRLLFAFLAVFAVASPVWAEDAPTFAPQDWLVCKTSDDCVLVDFQCCDQKAVNKDHATEAKQKWNSSQCQLQQCNALPKSGKAVCLNNQCDKSESR